LKKFEKNFIFYENNLTFTAISINGRATCRCIAIRRYRVVAVTRSRWSLVGMSGIKYFVQFNYFETRTMSESMIQELVSAINHNANLLEQHLTEGVYVHHQDEPSKIWTVTHSLGSLHPLIETYDSYGNHIGHSVNRVTQTFSFTEIVFEIPVSGIAIVRF
jgi:hypothetical protein